MGGSPIKGEFVQFTYKGRLYPARIVDLLGEDVGLRVFFPDKDNPFLFKHVPAPKGYREHVPYSEKPLENHWNRHVALKRGVLRRS